MKQNLRIWLELINFSYIFTTNFSSVYTRDRNFGSGWPVYEAKREDWHSHQLFNIFMTRKAYYLNLVMISSVVLKWQPFYETKLKTSKVLAF